MCLTFYNTTSSTPLSQSTIIDDVNVNLKGFGKTIRFKTNASTFWVQVSLNYNVINNTIDGVGYSVFQRKKIPFIIMGKVYFQLEDQEGNKKMNIQIKKIHLSNEIHNMVEYLGIMYITKKEKKIELISHSAAGELNFY
jgi:hypothetical protein